MASILLTGDMRIIINLSPTIRYVAHDSDYSQREQTSVLTKSRQRLQHVYKIQVHKEMPLEILNHISTEYIFSIHRFKRRQKEATSNVALTGSRAKTEEVERMRPKREGGELIAATR
ncbi:hypothetical protein C4D60_Mb08t05230 [Musa balbisiana]|uniref:Uncharacterized protein n=1 Tax=Musa balbisiana TaxID=52838 RepID=A0A4V4H8P3_MUSBA|nr:hypothetical protein C4D60_Mb08t05230 [Musa balbisiana]